MTPLAILFMCIKNRMDLLKSDSPIVQFSDFDRNVLRWDLSFCKLHRMCMQMQIDEGDT